MTVATDDHLFETIIGHDGRPARVLRDGATFTVPMSARDSASRDASRLSTGRSHGIIHTGDNHRPGSVFSADANVRDASEAARREWIADMTTAWKRTPESIRNATADARRGRRQKDPDEEDDDEIDDARQVLGDRAPRDAQAAQEVRDRAYREYCARLQDEWRTRP
jgi:hypothetical protein